MCGSSLLYQFNKKAFPLKNEKGKLAAKTSCYLPRKDLFDKQGQTRGILRTFQKVKNKRLKFVVTENPQKGESAVKKEKGNCSFKLFLLLSVCYKDGGGMW